MTRRITIDPAICHGKPTVRGLPYPIEMILKLLSAGMSSEEILADYEDREREDILAVLAYAARLSQVKRKEIRRNSIYEWTTLGASCWSAGFQRPAYKSRCDSENMEKYAVISMERNNWARKYRLTLTKL